MEVAMEKLALRQAMAGDKANNEAAIKLREAGVTISDWSSEDRRKFHGAAQASWDEFATSPEAKDLVTSHKAYLKSLGLLIE
jgi:TRAP-type C4-dicarboxylate transport system substrate-binding protein